MYFFKAIYLKKKYLLRFFLILVERCNSFILIRKIVTSTIAAIDK